jgi:hypothetical protein
MKFIWWLLNSIPDALNRFKEWRRANEVNRITKAIDVDDDVYIANKLSDLHKSEAKRTASKG